jgi:hypothetical protein
MATGVVAEWRRKPQISCESTSPGTGESLGVTNKFFGTWDTYKSLKAVTKSFSLVGLYFEQS